jgi:peptidoglycan/LPS O-acetylase OafA/YrhL
VIASAYVGLTTVQFALCVVVAFVGLCALCLIAVVVGAWVIHREVDEHAFRQKLRRAQERDEAERNSKCRDVPPVHAKGRAHRSRYDMSALPVRRGDL